MNQDFTSALETLQDAQSKAIGAPKVTTLALRLLDVSDHRRHEAKMRR